MLVVRVQAIFRLGPSARRAVSASQPYVPAMSTSFISRLLPGLLGSLAIATVAGASLTQAAPADQTVSIDAFAFAPAETSVPTGTSVVWTNLQNGVQHTTSSRHGLWDSGALSTGDAFRFTFTQVGDFAYQCTIHPSMRGIVHVVADTGAPTDTDGAAEQPAATLTTATLSTAPTTAPATQVAPATPLPPTPTLTPTPVVPTTRPTSTPASSYGY